MHPEREKRGETLYQERERESFFFYYFFFRQEERARGGESFLDVGSRTKERDPAPGAREARRVAPRHVLGRGDPLQLHDEELRKRRR